MTGQKRWFPKNCERLKFDHTTKWYMHEPGPILENKKHKILRNFEIQTYYLIPARRPDLVLINKKKRTCHRVDFAVPVDHWIKIKENEKVDKYLDLARELKKKPIVVGAFGTVAKSLEK